MPPVMDSLNSRLDSFRSQTSGNSGANDFTELHVLESVVVNGDGSASELLEEAIGDDGVDLHVLKSVVVNGDWLKVLEEAIGDHRVDLQVLEELFWLFTSSHSWE